MARPKPTIFMESVDSKTYKAEQVLEGEAVYAVFYKDSPIGLRVINKITDLPGPKYRKTTFTQPAHALNLADRLNDLFKTKDFIVRKMEGGEIYTR